jgi:DNA polymerase-4
MSICDRSSHCSRRKVSIKKRFRSESERRQTVTMDSRTGNASDGMGRWPRAIAHADLDAFYASVEALDNPELRGKPIIVGGRSARGVVTSASYEARAFGVRAAMPIVEARKLCPQGVFLAGRMKRYVEISRVVRRILERFSPVIEPLSLDEAFLDLTGTQRLLGEPAVAAAELKKQVREEAGLTVSVGVAPVKMVAKILSNMSKPDGLLVLGPAEVRDFLDPLPVERLWGVGRVTLARLTQMGIKTIGELARFDVTQLRSQFGSLGLHIHELANGRDPRAVIGDWQRKSYGEECTFERDYAPDSLALKRALIAHGEELGRRLRADGIRARTVTLKLKLARPLGSGRYPILTRSLSIENSTDDGAEISGIAIQLLAQVKTPEKIRLAGVQVSNLERIDSRQMRLFDQTALRNATRRARLNLALDQVTRRFGEDVLTRGLTRVARAAPTHRIK